MSDYQLQIADVLAQVNVVRDRLGFNRLSELPSAHQGDPAACLFYRGLMDCGVTGVVGDSISFSSDRLASVCAEMWGTRANGAQVVPPRQMRKTIVDFDEGKFGYYNDRL